MGDGFSWEYHRVIQTYSPIEVEREWTIGEIYQTAYHLYLADILHNG